MTYQLVGLGTYKLDNSTCTQIVKSGLEIGYRLIDTAQLYQNHSQVSEGIKLSGIPRTDIFITSKIHNSNIRKCKIAESIDLIKKELDTDYLDLILLHNPVKNYEKAWVELINCKEHLNIKHIGVSNFYEPELDKIIGNTGIIPWLSQIELNIFNQQKDLIEYNNSKGIITQAHTTLTRGNLLNEPELIKFSQINNYKPVEIMYKYVLDQGIGILPTTLNILKLKSNYEILFNDKKIFTEKFIISNSNTVNLFDKKILIRSCFFFTTARIFVFFKKIQKYKKFFLLFLYYFFIRRFEDRSLHYQE
jgi:2,5-diketo-D-gluconate reductase A